MRILVERLANEAQRLGLKVQGAAQTHWMLGCDGRPHIFFVKSLVVEVVEVVDFLSRYSKLAY